jgi:hypothetical protein
MLSEIQFKTDPSNYEYIVGNLRKKLCPIKDAGAVEDFLKELGAKEEFRDSMKLLENSTCDSRWGLHSCCSRLY